MIQQYNYFNEVRKIDFSKLPGALKQGHDFIVEATGNGSDWSVYDSDAEIASMIDLYLEKLNSHLSKKETRQKDAKKQAAPEPAPVIPGAAPPSKQTAVARQRPPQPGEAGKESLPGMVERIPEELRFIRRFVNLDGKTKTKDELRTLITSLQRAIVEKRIRKTSPYAAEIIYIQKDLLKVYNSMKGRVRYSVSSVKLPQFKELLEGEKVMDSVKLLKSYLSLQGKLGVREKAIRLRQQFQKAAEKKRLLKNDPYAGAASTALDNLNLFIKSKKYKTLVISQSELNGLQGILNGLDGVPEAVEGNEQPQIMNSMDFAEMQFETLGFTGKWLELIGDPSVNFTVMVYGLPKLGKSFLCIDFAGYLAASHGNVLYVGKEEGLGPTLRQKVISMNARHPRLTVSSYLPGDLSGYQFVFLDSVSRLALKPEDLNRLRAQWPGISFVFIFQSTKGGSFRGGQEFQHDVDVIIQVPEKGKAVQMGRFNQGGEMDIRFPTAA